VERIVHRAADLDVHKDVIAAEVHLPGDVVEQGRFATTTPGLLVLRTGWSVTGSPELGMESTGVYWKAPYYMLEDAMQVWLLNARHMRNIPGRKTDVAGALLPVGPLTVVAPAARSPRGLYGLRPARRDRPAGHDSSDRFLRTPSSVWEGSPRREILDRPRRSSRKTTN
jgi:transposase